MNGRIGIGFWVLSVLAHILIIALLFWLPTPVPKQVFEAALITPDMLNYQSLAAQKSAEEAAYAAAKKARAALRQKQLHQEAQIKEFAEALDSEIKAEFEAQKKALQEAARAESAMLDDFKHDASARMQSTEAANKAALQEADAQNKVSQTTTPNTPKNLADGAPTQGDASSNGQGAGTNTGAGLAQGQGRGASASEIADHVRPHWHPPAGSAGTRLSAKVRVDDNGNVLSVSISGGNEALRDSLERAIYSASPITPLIGTTTKSVALNFIAN